MIKLIATDVDGTLVKDGTMQIDHEYMTVIKELVQKGIIFAVCSHIILENYMRNLQLETRFGK